MMSKIARVFQYLCVLSVMIMGFNQALITLVKDYPYQLLDTMTIGSGLFILMVGLINLTALTICNQGLFILAIVANIIASLYIVLINISFEPANSYIAILPFILLLGFNVHSTRILPKVVEKP